MNEAFAEKVVIFIIATIVVLFITKIVMHILEIRRESRYITSEIKRSYGKERRHWVLKKIKLWLSIFAP